MALQRAHACGDKAGGASDTTGGGPRHGAQCATTRSPVRHDMALCARPRRSMPAAKIQGVRTMHPT